MQPYLDIEHLNRSKLQQEDGLISEAYRERCLKDFGIYISPGSRFLCPNISIGNYTWIDGPILIKGISPCQIGKYCAIGHDVRIITNDHDTNRASMLNTGITHGRLKSKGPVVIGNDVWIGDAAIILTGVTIGDGAVIGAGSLVNRNVPSFNIVGGVPARNVKNRFNDKIISQLQEISWWNWSQEKIARNRRFFETDLNDNPELDLFSIIIP